MVLYFVLGEKKFIHNRRVYSMMEFLGDAGGLYGSMLFIAQAIHYLVVNNDQPSQMLTHYFKTQPLKISCFERLILGTRLAICYTCCKKRLGRHGRLIEKTNQIMERGLDVRTLLRMQSLLHAQILVIFEQKHYKLIKSQS